MSLQHASPTPWGVAKCGDETQLGPLASTDQRDFPYHMLSAQMKKLSKEWCKWEAFIIFNVCLLEQLLHMWKCSFPGSGQTLLVDGKVENNFFFSSFFCAHNLSLWFSKLPYHDLCIVFCLISLSPLQLRRAVMEWLVGQLVPSQGQPSSMSHRTFKTKSYTAGMSWWCYKYKYCVFPCFDLAY